MSTVAERRSPQEADRSVPAAAEGGTIALYGAAIFLAAALLFVVQPMVGRMVLPRLGGSPEVWNTSMVFFQLALLAGYAYAHFSVRWLGLRRQILVHAAVLALPLLVLPVSLPAWSAPPDGWQSPWLLALLCAAVGAPFFVLATASPLLQRWLASTGHEAADDPYFLYASSNAGSLLGLLAYPLLVEPMLPLDAQSRLWSIGYGAFVLFVGLCAFATHRFRRPDRGRGAPAAPSGSGTAENPGLRAGATGGSDPGGPAGGERGDGADPPPTGRERLFWVVCAFLPSSLLLAVTHHLTADVVPMPLLWVLPLAVYLGTYIVAFSRRRLLSLPLLSRGTAVVAVALALVMLGGVREPVWAMVLLHLAVLAVVGLLCHGRLARRRPATSHLTEFYLLVAVGGVLGGAFNALLAPHLFDGLLEYPIAVAAACLLRLPGGREEASPMQRVLDLALPAALGIAVVLAEVGVDLLPWSSATARFLLIAAVPAFVCFLFSPRRVRFAVGIAVLLGVAYFVQEHHGRVMHAERTFFGIHRVVQDSGERFTTLRHGGTIHGVQSTDPDRRGEPLGYYHPSGPGGEVMGELAARPGGHRIAFVGLGTGALAALAAPDDRLTLYEIDPAVVRIAEDPRFFTYLSDTPASYETVVADGRIALEETDARFDLLVLDAFSSATVPVHLLTREALRIYLDRLEPDGVLLFHVSSRHLDLGPVLGALARDLGLAASQRFHFPSEEAEERGILSSRWVLLGREPSHLEPYVDGRWRPLTPPREADVWTDDFADVLSAYRWN